MSNAPAPADRPFPPFRSGRPGGHSCFRKEHDVTQEEIRQELKMTAPVYGLRGSRYRYFVKGNGGVWREPGGENWVSMIERDLPVEKEERVRRG